MKLHTDASDSELLQSMLAGEEEALAALYRRRQGGIYRFALHMCGSQVLAEDVTQEVFMVLIRDGQTFDPARGSLNAFLVGVARNLLLRRLQRERFYVPMQENSDDEATTHESFLTTDGPMEDLSRVEAINSVRTAVLALPERYREVVVLCDLQEMSYVEAAEVLGCAVGTVRSRLHRARALLIEKLRPARQGRGGFNHSKIGEVFRMNCQNFEIIVNELARQQMMEANVREQALAHMSECGVCALRLEDQRALTQELRALTSEMNDMEAPARIEGELLIAFHNHKFTRQSAREGRSAIHDWRYWAAAAAAVLFVVIGIAATRSRPAPVAAENPYIPAFGPTMANTNQSAELPGTDGEPKHGPLPKQGTTWASHKPKRHANSLSVRSGSAESRGEKDALTAGRESTIAANYSGNEIATDFLPVGYMSPMNLQDGGQVMRVELPRSALAGFGLPINMERVNERVKADVLVGPDGQARAIRFVQ